MDTHDEEFEQEQESPGKGLRAQLEQALNDKKGLEAQLSELKGKVRQAEVGKVLSAKGVNHKIAQFIPSEIEGEEAIAKWLDENADVFGVQPQGDTPADESKVPEEVKESAARMQNLGSASQSPSKLADIEARMKGAQTAEELQELWQEAQKFVL